MTTPLTDQSRNPLVAVLFVSIACLASALYLQESKDWFPCALCVVQRYAYLGTAFFALMALMVQASPVRKGVVALAVLSGLAGLGAALYHVWVLSNPGVSCGVDPLQLKLNALPWTGWWPMMFEADGLCTAEYPPFLGLDLPAWSAIGFAVQLMLLIKAVFVKK
ncbi:MAG: disulfide bond formation protein B [Limnobacter sp.]|nr:disulfide bond formation protein B [Limnobacter sp.]